MKTPILIGLSAGGFGGFREYARKPGAYAGYICIAAFPPADVLARLPRKGRIRLVAGGKETFVTSKALQRVEHMVRQRVPDYASHIIPHQDHFFMLNAEEETRIILKKWNTELQKGKAPRPPLPPPGHAHPDRRAGR